MPSGRFLVDFPDSSAATSETFLIRVSATQCLQAQITLETCCPVLAMARQYNCWELAEHSVSSFLSLLGPESCSKAFPIYFTLQMQFILRRFEDIMQSEHKAAVQQLPEDILLDIIRDNNLEAGSETNVLLVRH